MRRSRSRAVRSRRLAALAGAALVIAPVALASDSGQAHAAATAHDASVAQYLSPPPPAIEPPSVPLAFAIQPDGPVSGVALTLAGAPDIGADGRLATLLIGSANVPATTTAGLFSLTLPQGINRPGTYWWQAVTVDAAGNQLPGPIRSVTIALPPSWSVRRRIPASIGRQGRGSFYLSTADIPTSVDPISFGALARRSASRWGLRGLSWTSAPAGPRDGYDVIGFGKLPANDLGLEERFIVRHAGVDRVVEQDIVINDAVPWYYGAGYPRLDQYDLQSVLLHELGHMAGNLRHRQRCSDSPMVEALAAGEWWHTPRDWYEFGCASAAAAPRASLAVDAAGAQRLAPRPAAAPLRFAVERIALGSR